MSLWRKVRRAAAALAIGSAITYLGWLSLPTDRAPQAKTKAEEVIAQNPGIELFLTDTSPNGRRIAFQGRDSKKKLYDIYVYDLDDQTLENITQSDDKNESYAEWLDNETFKYKYLDIAPDAYFKWAWKNTRTGKTGSVPDKDSTLWMLLAGMFAVPFAALLGAGYLRRKKNQSVICSLGDNIDFTAGTGFLSSAAFFSVMQNFLSYHPDAAEAMRPDYLNMAAANGIVSGITANLFGNVVPPRFINGLKYFKYHFQAVCGSYEGKRAAIGKLQSISANPTPYDFWHAHLAIKNNRLDEGLVVLKQGLVSIADEVTAHELKMPFAWPTIKIQHALERKNPAKLLTKSVSALIDLDFNRAVNKIDEFAAEQPGPDSLTAKALYLQSLVDAWPEFKRIAPKKTADFEQKASLTELTGAAWKTAISSTITSKDPQWKTMGESRNEVMESGATQFLQSTYVFKRCDLSNGQRLKRERENILALQKEFGGQIPKSLAYVEHNGYAYHVLLHKNNNTLENEVMLNPESRHGNLLNAMLLLMKLTKYGLPECEGPPEGPIYYKNRLETVFCDQLKRSGANVPAEVYDSLTSTSENIHAVLKNAPMGMYKDANLRNWLVEDDGKIVAIDFEHRIMLPVQLDLVNLLEFIPIPEAIRESLILIYFKSMSGEQNPTKFMKEYKFAALQKHMELSGYRARDKEWSAVKYHIGVAKEYANDLGEANLSKALETIALPS